jgi:hypothetical protein
MAIDPEYVENRVIEYFSVRFNTPPNKFDQDTDCKDAFGFEDGDWRSLADVFNQLTWMKHIQSHITRQEMQNNTTIGKLTQQIVDNAMV